MARGRGTLRVIAGTARGRRLVTPAGSTTRPMRDRVREAVFSALEARALVAGASVLDCYAGSGALAVEALSRGADHGLLLDRDAEACAAATENLATAGFSDRARVERVDVAARLAGAPPPEAPFDLVACDPPLALSDADVAAVLGALRAPAWTARDAVVVLQRRGPLTAPVPGWGIAWERRYGDTLVCLLSASAGPGPDPRAGSSTSP